MKLTIRVTAGYQCEAMENPNKRCDETGTHEIEVWGMTPVHLFRFCTKHSDELFAGVQEISLASFDYAGRRK